MKKSQKALLLSALVLPGLGQMTLKRYKTGIVLILIAAISSIVVLRIAMMKARAIVDQLMAQGVVPDIATIMDITSQVTAVSDDSTFNHFVWVFIAGWLVGILDVWFAGKRSEKADKRL